MRQGAWNRRFTAPLAVLAVLLIAPAADAVSLARQCRQACGDEIASCVAGGGRRLACKRQMLRRCRTEGLGVCQGPEAPAILAGSCTSPTVISAQGGTFTGTTSGTSLLAGSCGSSANSPERVFQWTPTVSGTATIQTCGAGTNFDTVLYMRSGVCASGPEVVSGCNDDACPNSSGLFRASRIKPTVNAGQTYFIVVDGYGGAQGTFSLTVTAPGASTTTTLRAVTSTTTTTLPGACSSPTVISAAGGTFSGTTSGTSSQAGSCGSSGTSPERVFQWTPTVSGTATIQTCGGSTSYDTVLYVQSGACGTGSEIALGCNDDACDDQHHVDDDQHHVDDDHDTAADHDDHHAAAADDQHHVDDDHDTAADHDDHHAAAADDQHHVDDDEHHVDDDHDAAADHDDHHA